MAHKYNPAHYAARKAAQAEARARDGAIPASIPELRALVRSLLDALGMR